MGDVYNAMMRSGQGALLEDSFLAERETTTSPCQPLSETVLRLRITTNLQITKQFEQARVKLLQQAAPRRLQVHTLTSTLAGEGRTTCALHLAISFAQLPGSRVLLIDMDSRSQHKLADHFEGKITEGFRDFIDQSSTTLNAVTYRTNVQSLYVMPLGNASGQDPDATLSHPRLSQLLDRVPDLYDHVVIDAPPILGQGGGLQVSQLSDETIMAVALRKTPVHQLQRARQMLADQNSQITGMMLTQQRN